MDGAFSLISDAKRQRLVGNPPPIPFLSTPPAADIVLLFAFLPLWWILGVDQFIWLPVTSLSLVKVVARNQSKIVFVRPARWLSVFLCAYLVSGLFIVERFRVTTFARNFIMYLSATCLLIVLTNVVKTKRQLLKAVWVLGCVAGLAALVGTLGILDLFVPEFTAPVARIVPSSIKDTGYGSRTVMKSSGQLSWFAMLGVFFRVRAFFMYATMYAAALAMLIPLELFLFAMSSRFLVKVSLAAIIVLSLINLVYTTGRGAVLGFAVGLVYFLLTYSGFARHKRQRILFLAIVILVAVLPVASLSANDVGEGVLEVSRAFVNARGGGSYESRMLVYRETIESWMNRPIFGWGTQRDIPDFSLYPMGSHSHYLGTLYKQGSVGLLIYGATLLSVWRRSRMHFRIGDHDLVRFIDFASWAFVANCVNGLTDVMDLDAIVMHILWTIIGLLLCGKRIAVRSMLDARVSK
jgi:O-antigen ligase